MRRHGCGEATPCGHSRCVSAVICAGSLRTYRGPASLENAVVRLQRCRSMASRTRQRWASELRCAARAGHWSERNPPHAQSQLCCRITMPAHANVTWCDCGTSALACAVRDGCRHASCFPAAGGQCVCSRKMGLRLCCLQSLADVIAETLQDSEDGAKKKTVAAALAAPTVIDSPVRITWSRGGRTCSESTSAACRCRPCPAGR